MKVGFLVNSVSREAGGLFHSVRGLARSVVSDTVNATAFGMRDPNTALDAHEWRPVTVCTFHSQFPPWGYSSHLVGALVAANLDILSSHGLWKYSSVASLRWHQQTARRYIVHPHGMLESWALRNAGWKKRIAALLYENQHLRKAACLRALCEPEAQSILAYGMRNPICIIPNGVDLPLLSEGSALEAPAFARGRKILLYLGRLHPKKNVASLIRAWEEVCRSEPSKTDSWMLAIAGWDQSGYESELKRMVTVPSVIFLGPRFGAEKAECYRTCDAFILPSLSEGLPMTVLEAWGYAKPVLMTRDCNLPEGFAAGAALQIGTAPEQIAAGLKELVELSDHDRRTMGDHGRTLVSTKFSWVEIGEQMHAAYDWVLGGGAIPATVRL